jgi:hypothetical protein
MTFVLLTRSAIASHLFLFCKGLPEAVSSSVVFLALLVCAGQIWLQERKRKNPHSEGDVRPFQPYLELE